MTHSSDSQALLPTALPPSAPRPYAVPELTELGMIESLTAGPDSGAIDQIFGGTGGFMDPS